MSAQILARLAAIGRRSRVALLRRRLTPAAMAALVMLVGPCAPVPPQPLAGPDPANPSSRVPPAGYQPTVGPYTSQRPVEPAPWQEQNQRVAPTPKKQ